MKKIAKNSEKGQSVYAFACACSGYCDGDCSGCTSSSSSANLMNGYITIRNNIIGATTVAMKN